MSEEKFKEVQEAYDVLSDEKKRKVFDRFGYYNDNLDPDSPYGAGAGASAGGGAAGFDFSGFDFSSGQASGGSSSFRDIFSDLFGGSGGGAGTRARTGTAAAYAEKRPRYRNPSCTQFRRGVHRPDDQYHCQSQRAVLALSGCR